MIPRTLAQKVLYLATKFPVVSITGPRQSGKTTLARSLFPDYGYVNLENPDARMAARTAPLDFLRQSTGGLIIDEAQYVPELFSYLQLEADERNQPGNYILCGSQHFLLMERITQSLAGRVGIVNLLPFSVEELLAAGMPRQDPLTYIFKGFFPRLHAAEIAPADFYPAYIQTYIERDARQIVNVSDLDAFQSFVRLCAGRIGNLFNQSEIGALVGVDQKTARRWLTILQTGFQAFTLPPYFRNFDKRIVKTPKLYFWDTGIACSLLGIRSEFDLRQHFAFGALFENFILVEILKRFYHRGIRPNAYFWSERGVNEVDLLIEEGGRCYPIEIKAAQTILPAFFKGIRAFNAASGNPPEYSNLIYAGEHSYPTSQGEQVRAWFDWPDFGLI
ncbi:MAG: ATP-binding protein [Saprospiraceae bacterium]|nr:ATP-binding protein [Saprospiraceae bacterium]MDW8230989.1 ATP-binding protein [Saprospiraceae bacterium]